MAGALEIRTGTRLQTAFDTVVGVTPQFDMLCTFARSLDESAFLVSVPMKDGQPLPIDDTKKMLFAYGSGEEKVIMAGYADDLVTEGIRRYWKIRRVTEQRQFLERVNERYKITLRLEYTQATWMPDEDGVVMKEEAMTLDISAGGMAIYLNRKLEVGEVCELTLPRLGTVEEGRKLEGLVGIVCWLREAPRGSLFRNICGLQFRFSDEADRTRFVEYLGYMKKKYKL